MCVWFERNSFIRSVCQGVCAVSGCDPTGEGVSCVCFLSLSHQRVFSVCFDGKNNSLKVNQTKTRVTHHRTEIEKNPPLIQE